MGALQIFNKFSNLSNFQDFQRFVSAFLDQLYTQFNGKIDFVSNIRASGPSVVGFTNSTNVRGVTHGLGFVPNGFLTINKTAAADIYAANGTSYPWTSTVIYLQASAGVTATFYVI